MFCYLCAGALRYSLHFEKEIALTEKRYDTATGSVNIAKKRRILCIFIAATTRI